MPVEDANEHHAAEDERVGYSEVAVRHYFPDSCVSSESTANKSPWS